jgi:SET domain
MATKAAKAPVEVASKHRYETRNRYVYPAKRKPWAESWEALEERGKRRRMDEDNQWRRRDSLTHLVASIYADIEAAIEIQHQTAGAGDPRNGAEGPGSEASEDLRLDRLRELRLAVMFSRAKDRKALKAAAVPRGRRFDSVRAARDVVSRTDTLRRKRLSALVGVLGWTTIAICLHSANFCTRFLDAMDAADYTERLDQLTGHKRGIDFFAKSRLFDLVEQAAEQRAQDVLFRDLSCLLAGTAIPESRELSADEVGRVRLDVQTRIDGLPGGGTGVDHPHEWKLSADGQTATRLNFLPGGGTAAMELQMNIQNSEILFNGHKWGGRSKWLLRDEPRYRSSHDGDCEACNDEGEGEGRKWRAGCQCSLDKLKIRLSADGAYFGDRVELRNINPVLGTGVRALQHLPARSLLAEYVGEIYPVRHQTRRGIYQNNTYMYCQRRALSRGSEDAMYIDPSIRGNWTRYVNHSCRPKTDFTMYTCGDKMLTCLTVRDRPIEFGEEITVSYGRNYFVGQKLACRCGEDICTLWNAGRVDDRKTTLRQAKDRGIAPDWAK